VNDRIRLAEAMNLPEQSTYTYRVGMNIYEDQPERTELGVDEFNPFEDANDDYAVKESLRYEEGDPEADAKQKRWDKFIDVLDEICPHPCLYEIGDYARAALKVIE